MNCLLNSKFNIPITVSKNSFFSKVSAYTHPHWVLVREAPVTSSEGNSVLHNYIGIIGFFLSHWNSIMLCENDTHRFNIMKDGGFRHFQIECVEGKHSVKYPKRTHLLKEDDLVGVGYLAD